jgi:FKBP-type peptidyl-prolyl cis-trans isomerase (trigger factor)
MQITQTLSEDLRRQFTVTVSASELDNRVTKRLEDMKGKINLKGFRPGKAPLSHLKKQFGKSVLGEVVEEALRLTLGAQAKGRPAQRRKLKTFRGDGLQPEVDLTSTVALLVPPLSRLDAGVRSAKRL